MQTTLRQYSNLLVTYLKPQRFKVTLLGVLLCLAIALQLIIPQILRGFIDISQSRTALDRLWISALLFIGVVLLKHLTNIGATYLSEDVGWNATNALRIDLATHCLGLDMTFHTAHSPGEMIERIDGDIQVLSGFFSQLILIMLSNVLLLAGVIGVLYFEDWRLGLAFTVFTLIAFAILSRIRNLATPHWQASRQSSAELFGFLEERLAGTIDIRANGGTAYSMRRLYSTMREFYQNDLRAWFKSATVVNTMITLFIVGLALALGLSVYLLNAGAITIGTVYLIYAYTLMLFQPLERITKELDKLQSASASIVRVEELFQIKSTIADGLGPSLPAGPLPVEFDAVEFSYDESAAFLKDLSFKLEAGKTLGLLGRTGSGKTSITRLLLRLYEPQSGEIRLAGQDIRSVPLVSLRQHVSIVTQDVHLFNATVRDNLTFFDEQISDERILKVIRELELWEWYESLEQGLDTILEAGGGGLSAGEAQLLAFTRVFLKDPGLVILDEASSRLDPNTERLIERAVHRLLQNRTGIIIAHRLATVQQVDEIMILKQGAICEYGARADLVSNPESIFSQLLQTGIEETLA